MQFKRQAFTLVEIIVVITILTILSAVWFISYSSYLYGARDSTRISQLTKVVETMQGYSLKKRAPMPDDYITLTSSGSDIAYQWKLWKTVLESLDYEKDIVDPKDKTYYSYFLTKKRKGYQFLAFMESSENAWNLSALWKTYANIDYSNRFPRTFGVSLWILTDTETNTPLEDMDIPAKKLEVKDVGARRLRSYLTSKEYVEWNSTVFSNLSSISKARWKWWGVNNNTFECRDPNNDWRCAAVTWDENVISPSVTDSNCYDPANIGIVGNWFGCDGMLIVDNTMLRWAATSYSISIWWPDWPWLWDGTYQLIGPDSNIYTFGDTTRNIFTWQVTDMSLLFQSDPNFNENISYWDVGNVVNMASMFRWTSSYNQPIDFDTSNVKNMNFMFEWAASFDQNISWWNIAAVTGCANFSAFTSSNWTTAEKPNLTNCAP